MYVDSREISRIFRVIERAPFESILLRNTGYELPDRLAFGKDIDLLLHDHDREEALYYFVSNGFEIVTHPANKVDKQFGITEFDFLRDSSTAFLDLNYQLFHCNFERNKFLLHNAWLQKFVWNSCIQVSFGHNTLNYIGHEAEFIVSFTRCVIDKRCMSEWNFQRLMFILKLIDDRNIVLRELELIFKERIDIVAQILDSGVWNNELIEHSI